MGRGALEAAAGRAVPGAGRRARRHAAAAMSHVIVDLLYVIRNKVDLV